MMPCKYVALDGSSGEIDLDSVIDVVLGYSARRSNWTATIIYDQRHDLFVELRSAPPDFRGNSADEAEEVSERYLADAFSLSESQIRDVRRNPDTWSLIIMR
jgi:hypothetical protein